MREPEAQQSGENGLQVTRNRDSRWYPIAPAGGLSSAGSAAQKPNKVQSQRTLKVWGEREKLKVRMKR